MARLATVARVFRNPSLRRVELAFVTFNAGEWGAWIAMLVYASHRGGATTAGLVALVQLVPAALFAPWAASLGDRHRPGRVLALGYLVQAAAVGATAVTLFAGPPLLAYALAAVAATAVTITRPTQAALLPALARTPDELTATNVVSGWIESASILLAPALAGVLLGWRGPGAVFAVLAVVLLGGALLTAPVPGPAPIAQPQGEAGTLRALAHEPGVPLLVGLVGAQYIVIGALDVLFVVLAISVLGLGDSGAGYLNAAFGAGGVIGIAATVALVGRARLAPPLVLGIAAWSGAFLLLGARPSTAAAFVLLAAAGVGRSLLDVSGRTLLQRLAPPELLARTFGALEGISMAALAIGALLAPFFVNTLGARAALVCVGAILPLALALSFVRLRAVDAAATAPVVEIALLRTLPLFEPLGAPELESLARSLTPLELPAGADVVRVGEMGDRYYAIADGELSVSVGGVLRRGDGLGEIALLAGVARTATVTALTRVKLYALEREPFVAAVTGHPAARRVADSLVQERLHEAAPGATIAP
jgi:MFS family permease